MGKEKEPANINIKGHSHFCGLQIFSRAGCGDKRDWEGDVTFCFLWGTMAQDFETMLRHKQPAHHWTEKSSSVKPGEASILPSRQTPTLAEWQNVEEESEALPKGSPVPHISLLGQRPKNW